MCDAFSRSSFFSYFLPRLHLEKKDVEVVDLVLTSALASQIKRDGTSYDLLGVVDHADYESNISFLIRPTGGPVWFTEVSHCGYMRYHETLATILVDLNKSYQNIPKSPHIARKKCHLYGVKIRVFFLLHQKRT
jgi:hypothetical protein